MSTSIRLGVVDHHPLFRAGVIHVLALAGDCEVVAEGGGEADALRLAAEHSPDVLLIDLHGEFSVEAVQRLATKFPATRIIIMTGVAAEDQVAGALRAGAAGYMLKAASGAELAESIRRVHRGEFYVFPRLAAALLTTTLRRERGPDPFTTLTTREEQIFNDLTRGFSNKEIARHLNLTEKTIKHYVSGMFEKLEVRNRVEAALLGQRRSSGLC
jgi:two-component system, NarL family, nitrate/nitrite response regulator NarL